MKSIITVAAISLLLAAGSAQARKDCSELQGEIGAQLQQKGVQNYTLEAVASDAVGDREVVGSCDGGTRKLVYSRGSAATTAPADPGAAASSPIEPAPAANPESPPLQNY